MKDTTHLLIRPHFIMIQKFLPNGPTKSVMNYEIYRNKHSSQEDFERIASMYARVMSEDKVLCEGAQKNLNSGVFVNGELHPRWEKGPLFFQKTCREVVTEHWRREKAVGCEVWPARQRVSSSAKMSEEEVDMCGGSACEAGREGLAW